MIDQQPLTLFFCPSQYTFFTLWMFCVVNYVQNEKYFLFLQTHIRHPISYFVLSFQGTPLYMAPELIEEKPYDLAADLGLTQLNAVGKILLQFSEIVSQQWYKGFSPIQLSVHGFLVDGPPLISPLLGG